MSVYCGKLIDEFWFLFEVERRKKVGRLHLWFSSGWSNTGQSNSSSYPGYLVSNVRISFEMTVSVGTELDIFRRRGSGENAIFVPNLTYESIVGFAVVMLSGEDLLTGEINSIVQAMNAEDNSFMTFSFDFKRGSRTDDDFVVIDNFLMITAESVPIPEPSTAVFLFFGGLVFRRRRPCA